MENIINQITILWGSFIVLLIIITAFLLNKWFFKSIKRGKEKVTITREIISAIIILLGILAFTISLPIDKSLKAQIISLVGIVLSAAIALSSTTLIGNAPAGLMNSSIKNFKPGDFVKIEENFGMVTKKGLFRTEIQTEDRNLTSLPNLYLATNPVKIVRETGTIISVNVSLGYDLNHYEIEKHLIKAAGESGLQDPFIYIDELGDFSVTYRVNGILKDINKYFTTVFDNLHIKGIEIVSPTFVNQRQVNDTKFVPVATTPTRNTKGNKLPDGIVFDKAIEANKIEEKEEAIQTIENKVVKLKRKLKDGGEKKEINRSIERLEEDKERLKKTIEDLKNNLENRK